MVLFLMCSCIILKFSFPFTSIALIQRISFSFYKCQVVVCLRKTELGPCGAYYILVERWENGFCGWLEGGKCYVEKQTWPELGRGTGVLEGGEQENLIMNHMLNIIISLLNSGCITSVHENVLFPRRYILTYLGFERYNVSN